jgi:hypothetical protein
MARFHERTLALLGEEGIREERSVDELLEAAREMNITLPAAYVEWCKIDDGSLLYKYSNQDNFWFDPRGLEDYEGIRGIAFHQENQGNFTVVIPVDQGDDPPVYFGWVDSPPWVECAKSFSDYLYAQIFDCQYKLAFEEDGYPYITDYVSIELRSDRCLVKFREWYEEVVTTQFEIEGTHYTQYRFLKSPKERIIVSVVKGTSGCSLQITGDKNLTSQLKLDFLQAFWEDVIPSSEPNILCAFQTLGRYLDQGRHVELIHNCLEHPTLAAIQKLSFCHRMKSLVERYKEAVGYGDDYFQDISEKYMIGDEDWGVTITIVESKERMHWWQIESIREWVDEPEIVASTSN